MLGPWPKLTEQKSQSDSGHLTSDSKGRQRDRDSERDRERERARESEQVRHFVTILARHGDAIFS